MRVIKYIIAGLLLVLVIAAIAMMKPPEDLREPSLPGTPADTLLPEGDGSDSPHALDEHGANIQVTSPRPYESVSLPLVVTGYARVFENQFSYRVIDANGRLLTEGIALADAADVGHFGAFQLTVNYETAGTDSGFLEVFDYSAKDGAEQDIVTVPIKFSPVASTEVKVYYAQAHPGNDCSVVTPLTRRVPKTEAVARAALDELLRGYWPLSKEEEGLSTEINSGVSIKSVTIANGTATVRFSKELDLGVAGSCRVSAIRAQIEQTLEQFPTVDRVVIEVEGKPTSEVLQP